MGALEMMFFYLFIFFNKIQIFHRLMKMNKNCLNIQTRKRVEEKQGSALWSGHHIQPNSD